MGGGGDKIFREDHPRETKIGSRIRWKNYREVLSKGNDCWFEREVLSKVNENWFEKSGLLRGLLNQQHSPT